MTFLNAIDHWLNRPLTRDAARSQDHRIPSPQTEPRAAHPQSDISPLTRVTADNFRAVSAFTLGA